MTDLDFYIKKLQDLEPRGEWKDVYSHSFEKVYQLVYNSHYLKRNHYVDELTKYHEILIDLPFSPDDEEKLTFRRTQKHIIDLIYQIKTETKRIFLIHGKDTTLSDKVSSLLGRLKLDFVNLDFDSKEERDVPEFVDIAKECEFAIVVMQADDAARALSGEGSVTNRSSQNLIFQFGYFLSHVGRKNIILITQENMEIELPVDIKNFPNTVADKIGNWRQLLVRFISDNGIFIEEDQKNKILSN